MSRTVLLIDDDLQFYGQLCQRLSAYDFEVHQADALETSLAMAQELAADLIFIAVDLPDKEGFKLYHKARKLLSAPVILKTNTIPPEGFQKHSRLKSHADGYLDERTLTQEELLSHVHTLIGLGEPIETVDADVGIEVEELEMDEIELDEFGTEAYDDDVTAMPSDFLDERTKVAPSSPFLDPGLEAETDAAFAALGFDDDRPAPRFDTSDVAGEFGMHEDVATQMEEVTAVATEEALLAAEEESELAEQGVDSALEEEEILPHGQTTHVAPDDQPSDDVSVDLALEAEPNYELELDDEDALQAQARAVLPNELHAEAEAALPVEAEAIPLPVETDLSEKFSAANVEPIDEITAYGGDEPVSAEPAYEPALDIAEQEELAALPEQQEESPEPLVGVEAEDDLDLGLAAIAETAQEEQHAASQEDPAEQSALAADNARLRAELESIKKTNAGASAEFSREHEFLDLREKINKKEKALLDAQDQLTAKDRELLDGKDQLRQLERGKSELNEKNLQLEHEILSAKERQRSLQESIKAGQAELAKAQAAGIQALAEAANSHKDEIAGLEARQRQELSKAQSEHEAARAAAMEAAHEDHEAKLAQLESAKQSALAQAAAKLSEELAAAELAKEQALQEQADANSELLAAREAEYEAARTEALAAFDQQKQALADQHAGKFSRLERESLEAREALVAAHQSAQQEAKARHEEAQQEAAARHAEALQQAQAEAASALAALRTEKEEALALLAEQHSAATIVATKGHENALAQALAAADARRTQELEVAAQNLQSLDDRRREELNAAAEEREASEAQLLAKANQDRAGLEAEHGEVVAGFQRESAELRTALSTSRDKIAQVEQELQSAQGRIEEQVSELQSKDQIIALRDDRIAALKGEIAELEEQNASYQEQVLKAYQKIKSDESTTGRAKKALAIALTLLDETADLAVDTEAPPPENERRS